MAIAAAMRPTMGARKVRPRGMVEGMRMGGRLRGVGCVQSAC